MDRRIDKVMIATGNMLIRNGYKLSESYYVNHNDSYLSFYFSTVYDVEIMTDYYTLYVRSLDEYSIEYIVDYIYKSIKDNFDYNIEIIKKRNATTRARTIRL